MSLTQMMCGVQLRLPNPMKREKCWRILKNVVYRAETNLKFRVQAADTWHQLQQAQVDVDFNALDELPSTPNSNAGDTQPATEDDQYEIEDLNLLHANQLDAHELNQHAPRYIIYNEIIEEIVVICAEFR